MATRRLRTLSFVLTAACNLSCRYCYRSGTTSAEMPWPVLERRLHDLLPQCGRQVRCTFTGGEPLLAMPLLRRAVEEAETLAARRRQRIRWKILTNGLCLDRDALAFLDGHDFAINLSFDGVEAAQGLRGRHTFRRLDALLDVIRGEYFDLWEDRLRITMVVTPENLPSVASSVRYFLRKGVRELSPMAVMGRAACRWPLERIDELDAQFRRVSATLLRHARRTGLVPIVPYRKTAPAQRVPPDRWMCLAHRLDSVTVDVDGRDYACVLATSSYRLPSAGPLQPGFNALRVGRVGPGTLGAQRATVHRQARQSGVFQHPERRYSGYRRCKDCEYLGRCQVCPIAAATEPGWTDPRRVPDFLCAYNQVTLAHRDRFPCQAAVLGPGV